MKVMKFGGGTIKDARTLSLVADVVSAELPGEIVVVVSAVKGVTDKLHAVVRKIERDESPIAPFLEELRKTHEDVAKGCIKDRSLLDPLMDELSARLAKIERILYGISYTEEITEKTMDFVVSFGERLIVPILAALITSRGHKAKHYDADRIGLVTDGVFGKAAALLDEVEKNMSRTLLPEIKKGIVPVVTGYFGSDREGRTTTFGRGGSDYSAAILAYALNAESVEVWKDVAGFMTADPKSVDGAKPIRSMSYAEAAELAYFGAKIFHPRIVEPVAGKKIPIRVKNLFSPADEGTVVTQNGESPVSVVRSVAGRGRLSLVKMYGPAMAYTPGVALSVFTKLSEEDVNVYTMTASMASFTVIVDSQDMDRTRHCLEGFVGSVVHEISVTENVALISIVGAGLRETKGVAGRAFGAVAAAGVNVELVSDGGSDIALNFVIDEKDSSRAINALHREFIREDRRP